MLAKKGLHKIVDTYSVCSEMSKRLPAPKAYVRA